jgi:hypothetical protein
LQEPWSFLCRNPSEPLLKVEHRSGRLFDLQTERVLLNQLCRQTEHDGCIRGFKLVRSRRWLTFVPLAFRTRSVVPPRAVADDVIVDPAKGLKWRPHGWRVYMSKMLQGLTDVDHAARPSPSPYLPISIHSEHPPILGTGFGVYRPESAEKWLYDGEGGKFYYRGGDNYSDVSCSSDEDVDWNQKDKAMREGLDESDSDGDSVVSYSSDEGFLLHPGSLGSDSDDAARSD